MRALVTRPRANASSITVALRARGIEVVVEPMLTIKSLRTTVDLDGIQAALLTSANGAEALAAATTVRALPVLAVGDATATAARALGFPDVISADGDVATLAELVLHRLDPAAGALLHAAGTKVAGDLAGRLGGAGFEVRRAVLYEAQSAQALSDETTRALAAGTIDLVLFFSPRTAMTFVRLVRRARVAEACRQAMAFCLSPAVVEAASAITWRATHSAPQPRQSALLAVIDAALGVAPDEMDSRYKGTLE